MYRVVSAYAGSDTDKCIHLQVGDRLSSVHALDTDWYIGHNDRSGKTGVFPASCVDLEKDDKTIIKKTTDVEEEKLNSSQDATFTEKAPVVTFANIKLEQSVSVTESCVSWDESFQESLKNSTDVSRQETTSPVPKATSDGTNSLSAQKHRHNIGDIVPKKLKSGTDKLVHSKRGENARLKAIFGSVAGLVVGLLLYVILVYSFGYSHVHAAIIFAVSTVIFCICLSLSSLCRCIMALILPNFFTGKGRAVILSIIFGILVTGPVANITHNARESANSMACLADLIRNQTLVLERQLAEPLLQMTEHVEKQKQTLQALTQNMNLAADKVRSQLNEIDSTVSSAASLLDVPYQKCREPVISIVNECRSKCQSIPIISGECLAGCSAINNAAQACDALKSGENFVTRASRNTRGEINKAFQYFTTDVTIKGDFSGAANSSKSGQRIEEEVKKDVKDKTDTFDTIFYVVNKLLTLSLLLLFIQSFWYLRNYLSKDAYDNIYITNNFRKFDDSKPNSVLPLKGQERSSYVDTSSCKLNRFELAYARLGLVQVLLHFLLSMVTVIFDYTLFYILQLVRRYGVVDLQAQGQGDVKVSVKGSGPIADFYRVMLNEVNFNAGFSATLHVNKCLPAPIHPPTYTIPVLLLMYIIAVFVCILRGYGMRFRSMIAAFYYPEQEISRMEYLHKTIRHRRAAHQRFLRQNVISSHKERDVKSKLKLSTWVTSTCPCTMKCMSTDADLACSGCEQRSEGLRKVELTKCSGSTDDRGCTAMYCPECKAALNGACPLCTTYLRG